MENTELLSGLTLASELLKIKQNGRWKKYASSFSEYLKNTKIKQGHNTLYRYMRIERKFRQELGLDVEDLTGISINKLDELTKIITTQNKEKWIEKAKKLTLPILVKEIKNES